MRACNSDQAWILRRVPFIEQLQEVARRLLLVGRDAGGHRDVAHWLLRRHHHGLILSRQKAVAPIRFSVGRLAANVGNRDVGGQVVVFAAQRVANPCAGRRKALEDRAGIHKHAARAVRVGLRLHRMNERDVIDVPRKMRQQAADHLAALAGGPERPRALHQVAVFALEAHEPLLAGQRLAVIFLETGL